MRRLSERAKSKSMSLISVPGECVANAVAEPAIKLLSLAFTNATAKFIPRSCRTTLQAIIRGRVSLDSVIHSDSWRGYNGLVDVGYGKHLRINHSDDVFAVGDVHINGIESFRSYAKRRLQKFNGVSNKTFSLHLKECEYRFNHRHENLERKLLKLLEHYPQWQSERSYRIDEKEFYRLLESVVIEDEEKNSHPRQKAKAEI